MADEQLKDDIELIETYTSGFAAGTIAVIEARERVFRLARLGAAVEAEKLNRRPPASAGGCDRGCGIGGIPCPRCFERAGFEPLT